MNFLPVRQMHWLLPKICIKFSKIEKDYFLAVHEKMREFSINFGALSHLLHLSRVPLLSFYTSLKTTENRRFSDAFRGYRKTSVTWNGLIKIKFELALKIQLILRSRSKLKIISWMIVYYLLMFGGQLLNELVHQSHYSAYKR